MRKPQWIAVLISLGLVSAIFLLAKTSNSSSDKKPVNAASVSSEITIDSILHHALEQLTPEQATRISSLEASITRGDLKTQQLDVFHELAHFWKDSARIFEPYAWYEAEAARLENSEKTLTFAGHLFLDNMRVEQSSQLRKWKALQAKDLFERSLRINPDNDSTRVGLGSCYLLGGISETPMQGINMIREVSEKDSTHVFAQMMLGHGAVLSGQYDKAVERFERVARLQPGNLEAIMMLAEVFERQANKSGATYWYSKALNLVKNPDLLEEIKDRIEELKN